MASVFPHGNYRPFAVKTTDTSRTTAYTCPTGMAAAIVVWYNVADDAGAARTATIEWTDSSATVTYVLVYQAAVAANVAVTAETYLVLEPGDSVSVTSSAAGVEMTGAALEISKNT